jgi:hypothetical protein
MCHNGSKVISEFEKHDVSRLPHSPYSPDISSYDFWFFGIGTLKGVLKDLQFNSSQETEEVIPKVWEEVIFNEVQSFFHN